MLGLLDGLRVVRVFMGRSFRRRTRARFRVIHRRVYALSKGQRMASLMLSLIWSIALTPHIERHALPSLVSAFQCIQTIAGEEINRSREIPADPLGLEQKALSSADPFAAVEARVRGLNVRSTNLIQLAKHQSV